MNLNEKEARIFDSITLEQWKALEFIANTTTKEQWEVIASIAKQMLPITLRVDKDPKTENRTKDLKTKVWEVMKEVGIPTHICGYDYLQEAIICVYEDKNRIHNMKKNLYPIIAEKYNTTIIGVERGIRDTLKIALKKGNPEIIEKIFKGVISSSKTCKISNLHGIAALVDYVKFKI